MFLKLRDGRFIDAFSFGQETWGSCSEVFVVCPSGDWFILYRSLPFVSSVVPDWSFFPLDVVDELDSLPYGASCVKYSADFVDSLS